jgi:guanylate kinase
MYFGAPAGRVMKGTGMLLILSGPSGAGKTSIMKALLERISDAEFSISATTRPMGPDEADGVDYHFLTREQFEQRIENDEFLEHAEYAGNLYGTLRAPVDDALLRGRLFVLDIDVQGGKQVKRARPDAYGVFILPPSEESLARRLRERKRDSEEVIQRRLARAQEEIEEAMQGHVYDTFIVNRNLDRAIEEVIESVEQERERRGQNAGV